MFEQLRKWLCRQDPINTNSSNAQLPTATANVSVMSTSNVHTGKGLFGGALSSSVSDSDNYDNGQYYLSKQRCDEALSTIKYELSLGKLDTVLQLLETECEELSPQSADAWDKSKHRAI